jgi:hypothetical protein
MTPPSPNPCVPDKADPIVRESEWYGAKAHSCRLTYLRLKGFQIVVTAFIPVCAALRPGAGVSAALAALIGVAEGILQLGRYQDNWLRYRTTREALKREERLYDAAAGPYAGAADARRLYVERTDTIVSGEQGRWLSLQQGSGRDKAEGTVR